MSEGTGLPHYQCTCEMYKLTKWSSKQKTPLWLVHSTEEDEVPDHTFTCMHCRFYRQFLINACDTVQQGRVDLTPALTMVHESIQHMNMPIQLVGNVLLHCTTKFSVKGDDSYSIVHFTFHQGKCYAKCSDALCCAKLNSKKRIAKKISLPVHISAQFMTTLILSRSSSLIISTVKKMQMKVNKGRKKMMKMRVSSLIHRVWISTQMMEIYIQTPQLTLMLYQACGHFQLLVHTSHMKT